MINDLQADGNLANHSWLFVDTACLGRVEVVESTLVAIRTYQQDAFSCHSLNCESYWLFQWEPLHARLFNRSDVLKVRKAFAVTAKSLRGSSSYIKSYRSSPNSLLKKTRNSGSRTWWDALVFGTNRRSLISTSTSWPLKRIVPPMRGSASRRWQAVSAARAACARRSWLFPSSTAFRL